MKKTVRILIADDNPNARAALSALLNSLRNGFDNGIKVEVVAQASNGQEAINCIRNTEIDLVLMDAHMPVLDGIAATREAKAIDKQIKVVVLSMNPEYRACALAAGADKFLDKGSEALALQGLIPNLVDVAS